MVWLVRGKKIDCTRPRVMGILNLTPDSFSEGGAYLEKEKAVDRAFRMEAEGADIIDLGGESTRPGSQTVSVEEEKKRLLPVLENLIPKIKIPVSVDTYKYEVARAVLERGAHIINDITAGKDTRILKLAGETGCGVVLMHMQGTPATMQNRPVYQDVIEEISRFLEERVRIALDNGVSEEQIVVDPGIGFGKSTGHNLTILNKIGEFSVLSRPVMVGLSRKKFIGEITGSPVSERMAGTIAAVVVTYFGGANIFRVHDVKEVKQALLVAEAMKSPSIPLSRFNGKGTRLLQRGKKRD
ncbi:MAG: dihydropteroate synthase [Candidatus Omnitrophota bacterium]